MYQAFQAIVSRGRIKPLEKIKLKEKTPVLVTILDTDVLSNVEWKKLKKWVSSQRRAGKFTSYFTIQDAKQHMSLLPKT